MRGTMRAAPVVAVLAAAVLALLLVRCGGDSGAGVAGPGKDGGLLRGDFLVGRYDLAVSVDEAVDLVSFRIIVGYPDARVDLLAARTAGAAAAFSPTIDRDDGGSATFAATGARITGPGGLARFTFRTERGARVTRDDYSILTCLVAEPGQGFRPAQGCSLKLVSPRRDGLPEMSCGAPATLTRGETGTFTAFLTLDGAAVADGTTVSFSLSPAGAGSLAPPDDATSGGTATTEFTSEAVGTVLRLEAASPNGTATCTRSVQVVPPPCPDRDGDGFTDAACGGSDCDDLDPAVNPGADEVCDDLVDNDCDGRTDAQDPPCGSCPDDDGDGFRREDCGGSDCDDTRPRTNPQADEICGDGRDNDCDDLVDEGDCLPCPDRDGDGFADEDCGGLDCDDTERGTNPFSREACNDGVDNDCDGLVDGEDPACQVCPDDDGDGFEDAACGGLDCDDTRSTVNPAAPERCDNGLDDDCDGDTDCLDAGCEGRFCAEDGAACTRDICDGGLCISTPNDDLCDDGLFCTGDPACDPDDPLAGPGGCVPGAEPCGPGETCDEATDSCL